MNTNLTKKPPNPVSIPKRVLEALKPTNHESIKGYGQVSIPKRVLEALKLAQGKSRQRSLAVRFNP